MDLEKTAVKRIQSASEMALNHYGKPLLVTDSGGKDSAVCRELVRRSGVPHEIIHNLTTADAPQTVLYIRERFREAEAAGIPCEIQYPYYKGKRVTMWSLIPQKKIPPCPVLLRGIKGRERSRAVYYYGRSMGGEPEEKNRQGHL